MAAPTLKLNYWIISSKLARRPLSLMSAPAICYSLMYWSPDLIENYSKVPSNTPLCPQNVFGENFFRIVSMYPVRSSQSKSLCSVRVYWKSRRTAQGRSGFWRREKSFLREPPVQYSPMISWLLKRARVDSCRTSDYPPCIPAAVNTT